MAVTAERWSCHNDANFLTKQNRAALANDLQLQDEFPKKNLTLVIFLYILKWMNLHGGKVMETQLRVFGRFETDVEGRRCYQVELYDGTVLVDVLTFETTATSILTAPGYASTPQGARQQAKDHWL